MKKPVILLLHGWMQSSQSWKAVIQKLSNEYTIIAPDLPGFGTLSQIKDKQWTIDRYAFFIHQFIKDNNISGIVGHSLGGIIALSYVQQYSPHLTHLILCDVPVKHVPWLFLLKPFKRLFLPSLTGIQSLPQPIRDRVISLVALSTVKKSTQITPQLIQDIATSNPTVSVNLLLQLLDIPDINVEKIHCPNVLVIRGQYDQFVSKKESRELATQLHGSYIELKGIKHTPHMELEDKFSQTIATFLKEEKKDQHIRISP